MPWPARLGLQSLLGQLPSSAFLPRRCSGWILVRKDPNSCLLEFLVELKCTKVPMLPFGFQLAISCLGFASTTNCYFGCQYLVPDFRHLYVECLPENASKLLIMGSHSRTIVWFRRDLRIEDNPALTTAGKDGSVLPVFIWCPKEEAQFYPGRVSRWWLKQSLIHFGKSLRSLGVPLILMRAEDTFSALLQCINATGSTRVFFNHLYDPVSLVRDHTIKSQLAEIGINVTTFNGDLLYEPWEVYDEQGLAFTTFDAFWEKCKSLPVEPTFHLPPWRLVPPDGSEAVQGCSIEELNLEKETEKSSNALLSRGWSPGWSNADKLLNEFMENHLIDYSRNMMKVEGATTSLLSPYLHFGELSIRKVYQSVRMKQMQWLKEENSVAAESVKFFLKSLGLREYSRYLCFSFPFTHEKSLLGNLRHYPWQADEVQFKAWRQGRTGYPLVDAGMRELWATGWIHNRTRVIVSSFCVKFLLLPWTWGMKYFWDTLLDADLESDILGWQYISGSLPDGHQLDRLDSPEVQGWKFDPDGEYVRQWLPELTRVPTEWIHHPWDAPVSVLRAAGVELGLNYPKPIVDISVARERLDKAIAMMWELDRTSKAEKKDETSEVVDDNLAGFKSLDIPKVVVKREVTYTSSSNDQRVPSIQNLKSSCNPQCSKDIDHEKHNQDNRNDSIAKPEKSHMDEDLRSTAESSSARKRSMSESLCAVPTSSFSSSEAKFHDGYGLSKLQVPVESTSMCLWQGNCNTDRMVTVCLSRWWTLTSEFQPGFIGCYWRHWFGRVPHMV
ncbi:hypothetical protein Taro_039164 [Colocasia esculenta]|uniref:Photolyase/cryptochrome alpha/beta domain-containing protein n=1 Tax=Colocasia esculenta TaxID=4460 RepID=A0A843WFU9_COLES|nr:hypothetical protein [Colocasia esculenta]